MSIYHTFISIRVTEPDKGSLLALLRALDSSAGVQHDFGPKFIIKKSTDWNQQQINAAQNVLDNAPASSPSLTAQNEIDNWPISVKALVLTLIDQLNMLRSLHSLPAITPAQAIAAIRTKAGIL